MRLHFTKMQGAGNDFIVLDATRTPVALSPEQVRALADRRVGIGADQILIVDPAPRAGVDFGYRIYNAGGDEVEHCGNGARCFLRYVRERGLTSRRTVRVATVNRELELRMADDGRVAVDMGPPVFDPQRVPFDASGLLPRRVGALDLWPLQGPAGERLEVAVASMGNPHAVLRVDDADAAPVATLGPWIESHARFPQHVNAGFMQLLGRDRIALRVYERGAGETLACGTGACAAVATGIALGWLDARVDVATRGGRLTVEWAGAAKAPIGARRCA